MARGATSGQAGAAVRSAAIRSGARLAAALAQLACAPIASGPRELPVLEVRSRLPRVSEGVLLNEPLVVYFSDALDRSTVTPDSVRISGPDGLRARGTIEVEGESLRFVPAPVYARDLSDGGFRPGTEYVVELVGFPDPAGLRGADGAPLAGSLTWSFRTVVVDDPQVAVAFEDATPEHGGEVTLVTGTVVEGQPLYLQSAEPLDPSTVDDGDFLVRPERGGEPVRVHAQLVSPGSLPAELQPAARNPGWIQLLPLEAPLEPGRQYLLEAPALELRDYGGNPMWLNPGARTFGVVAAAAARPPPGRYQESFLDTARRSPVPPPALGGPEPDGTAHWGDDGAVRVRYPRAAGDGSAGAVELAGGARGAAREPRKDVQATRLTLADEAECALAADGLVVLRAQGLLRIGGKLARGASGGAGNGSGPSMLASFDGGTLSDWLARAAAEDPAWTVLIAGGDLVVDGTLDLGTPLLLVAGGAVRISGSVAAGCEGCAVAMLGEGGGRGPNAERADLVLDEPLENPLAAPLRLAVMSGPIPPRGKVARWLSGNAAGHAGSGRYRVRYLRDPDLPGGELVPRDHPSLLEGASSIRFVVELALDPGVPWDPPFVDEVVLTWEEAGR